MKLNYKKAINTVGYTAGAMSLGFATAAMGQGVFSSDAAKPQVEISQVQSASGRQITYHFEGQTLLAQAPMKQIDKNQQHAETKELEEEGLSATEKRLLQEIEALKEQNKLLQAQIAQLLEAQSDKQQDVDIEESAFQVKQETVVSASTHMKEYTDEPVMSQNTKAVESSNASDPVDLEVASTIHHVVYIFKNKAEQQAMWASLSDNQINDRWQGHNSKSDRYFIYVGAYSQQERALTRADELAQKIGVEPLVYGEKR
ncbi:MAG: SPOR domain-containing protein [Pseudomonadota bacterium]|nr:SPOR domain-containing protein [Pseudomonadota bacterium]